MWLFPAGQRLCILYIEGIAPGFSRDFGALWPSGHGPCGFVCTGKHCCAMIITDSTFKAGCPVLGFSRGRFDFVTSWRAGMPFL